METLIFILIAPGSLVTPTLNLYGKGNVLLHCSTENAVRPKARVGVANRTKSSKQRAPVERHHRAAGNRRPKMWLTNAVQTKGKSHVRKTPSFNVSDNSTTVGCPPHRVFRLRNHLNCNLTFPNFPSRAQHRALNKQRSLNCARSGETARNNLPRASALL